MLHVKFQNHRPSGSGEEDFLKVFAIYSHGGHFGHVTLTIYTKVHSPFLTMLLAQVFHKAVSDALDLFLLSGCYKKQ